MRKTLIVLTAVALAAAALTAPAFAGKKKKGTFAAEAIPYPGPAGCNGADGGTEGVNQISEPFKAPSGGLLTVEMVDFQGDWDLFVNDSDGSMIVSSVESQLTGSPPTEEVSVVLRKNDEVLMAPCNFLGGPNATVNWTFVGGK